MMVAVPSSKQLASIHQMSASHLGILNLLVLLLLL
jgi:hypothetical protein